MKLLNNLFEIVEISGNGSSFSATIKIFPDHIVYKGHFPGYPVTPGVILLQIVHELLEGQLKRTIRLLEMPSCKFLKVVNPDKETRVLLSMNINLKDNTLHAKALGAIDSEVFLKLSAVYIVQ
jgi:3-hydroxyacyl-[acyl-carrier-protein] dehydratase